MPHARFERDPVSISNNRVGTDAMTAISRVPGVSDPDVIEESDTHAVINYSWVGGENFFQDSNAHFREHGLILVGNT